MARLPGAEALGERPVPTLPRRTPMIAEYRPTTGMESVPAQELGGMARDFEEAARVVAIAKEQADTLSAEAAFTKLRQRQIEITYGEKGVMSLKGSQTMNRDVPGEYGAQLTGYANELSAGLGNDAQRQLFARRAQAAQLELQQSAFTHVSREQDVFAKEVLEGTIGTESQISAAGGDGRISLRRIDAAIDRYASRFGTSEQQVTDMKMRAADAIWSAKIKALVYADPVAAEALYRDPAINAQIGPANKPVLENAIKTAMMPVQSRADADAAMAAAKPEGGKATDIRAMLPKWIANAEAAAEARHPGNLVYRDLVTNRVKSYVSTIVTAQEGEQRQAYGTLVGLLGGAGGRKPTSQDQLFATPDARAAFLRLEPPQQVAVLNMIEHNARAAEGRPAQVNARLVNDIFPRLFLPADDPRAITDVPQLAQFVPQGLAPSGHSVLAAKIDEIRAAPEGRQFAMQIERVRREAERFFRSSILGSAYPDLANNAALDFAMDLDAKIAAARKATKDPRDLLTRGKPEYVLTPERLATYMRSTPRQAVADGAGKTAVSGVIGEPAAPAAPKVPPRLPGETPAAYLQRIGQ